MRFRCQDHALLHVEEYTISSAASSMHPCRICGKPAVQAYRPRAFPNARARILLARHEIERNLRPIIGPIRECQQWRLGADGEPWVVTWDFKYKDPADGDDHQYGVQQYFDHEPTRIDLEHCSEMARDIIARMLARKCGDKFQAPDYPLQLPLAVKARWV